MPRREQKSGGIVGFLLTIFLVGLMGAAVGGFFGMHAGSRGAVHSDAEAGSPADKASVYVIYIFAGVGFAVGAGTAAVFWMQGMKDD